MYASSILFYSKKYQTCIGMRKLNSENIIFMFIQKLKFKNMENPLNNSFHFYERNFQILLCTVSIDFYTKKKYSINIKKTFDQSISYLWIFMKKFDFIKTFPFSFSLKMLNLIYFYIDCFYLNFLYTLIKYALNIQTNRYFAKIDSIEIDISIHLWVKTCI